MAPAPIRSFIRSISLRLFVTCWVVYALHFATNIVREIYPALTLGDDLSFDVSAYLGFHPDLFAVPGRGAFINNNPGASMLAALPYALARPGIDAIVGQVQRTRAAAPQPSPEYRSPYPLAREFHRLAYTHGIDVKLGLAAAVMQTSVMAPLSALSAVVVFRLLQAVISSTRASVLLALLYAFGTPVFFRTAQLNQNVLVGHFALFAFALLWRPWDPAPSPPRSAYLLAGLLCGGAVLLDYSGVVVLLVIGLYAGGRWITRSGGGRKGRDLVLFASGSAVGVGALLSYQWLCFGDPFSPAQAHMPATALSSEGFRGFAVPRWDLLAATAFGPRFGLFTSAPLLVLALWVPAWSRGRTRVVRGLELACVLVFCAAFFLFCAANQYGWMQFNTGVRHVTPVSPFLFLLAAAVLLRMRPLPAVIIASVGLYWSWCLTMYRDVERGLGVLDAVLHVTLEGFRLPWVTTLAGMGYLASGASGLPLLVLAGIGLWLLWRGERAIRVTHA